MKVKVEGGIARFGTDVVLSLTAAQAAARSFVLEEVGKGKYRPKAPVEFKSGEELGVDAAYDDLPGTLRAVLTPLDSKGKAAKGKGKAKGETEAENAVDTADADADDVTGD